MLQAQYGLLNVSRNELHNITSKDILYTLKKINSSLEDLGRTVRNAVDKLMQFQIECFTQVNASACAIITSGETAFKFIIDKIAEHYEQAAFLEAILNSRNESIIVIGDKLDEIERQMDVLDSKIEKAERERIDKDADLAANANFDVKSCPTSWGKTLYTYESEHTVLDDTTCSGKVAVDVGNNTMIPYCLDERIPVNTSERLLWNLASCSVDLQTKAFGRYDDFITLMNTVPSKISASLTKVNIKRAWFDEAIFRDWEHFTVVSMKFVDILNCIPISHNIITLNIVARSFLHVFIIRKCYRFYMSKYMNHTFTEKGERLSITRSTRASKILP